MLARPAAFVPRSRDYGEPRRTDVRNQISVLQKETKAAKMAANLKNQTFVSFVVFC
jgi:hypothetical protein